MSQSRTSLLSLSGSSAFGYLCFDSDALWCASVRRLLKRRQKAAGNPHKRRGMIRYDLGFARSEIKRPLKCAPPSGSVKKYTTQLHKRFFTCHFSEGATLPWQRMCIPRPCGWGGNFGSRKTFPLIDFARLSAISGLRLPFKCPADC
jgi:hypothetical protein